VLKTVQFETTPKLSSYLWTINCGDFEVISSDEYPEIRTPMRVLLRRGFRKDIDETFFYVTD